MFDIKKTFAAATIAASALVVPMTMSAQPTTAAPSVTQVGTAVGAEAAVSTGCKPVIIKKIKKVKKVNIDNRGGNIGNGNGGNANGSSGSGTPGGNGGNNNSGNVNVGND